MKHKSCKIINKEQSSNSSWMIHYTLLYRGREYTETLQGEFKNRYDVGDIVNVDTYKDKNKNLCFMLGEKITE